MENELEQNNKNKTIYYDGSCPMCVVVIDKINTSSQKEKFSPKDIKKDTLPQSLTEKEVEKEIHVVDSEGKIYKNSDAILEILKEYKGWGFIVKIGRLPIIKQLLFVGYRFVAINRKLIFGESSRLFWVKIILISGLISSLLLSINLWLTSDRFFPKVPFLNNIPGFTANIDTLLFSLLIIFLIWIFVYPKPNKIIFPTILIGAVFVFYDQMRLQPWFYQYFLMLAILGLFSWDNSNSKKQQAILNSLRLVVASIYFFSGLQKINIEFMGGVFPWMVEPVLNILPTVLHKPILLSGVFVPFVEMALGIGLLVKKYTKYAITLALLMHTFILYSLGPIGHNWNSVVWPWNITMILFVLSLFYKSDFNIKDIFNFRHFLFQKIVFVLFIAMPILSFFNVWDSYLSSALYSGNTNRAYIYIDDSVKQKMPSEIQPYIIKIAENKNVLDIFYWSFNELNVPPYPETRVYKQITRNICEYTKEDQSISLFVFGKPTVFNADKSLEYKCKDL